MSARERVRAAYRRIEEVARPEIWISLRSEADALADAAAVDRRLAAGERLPLAGLTLAVKDNIDVAGVATTAGCPAFAFAPEVSAPVVQRLSSAGTVLLGKVNLDQFATGLMGTRSPYGAVRDSRRPDHVSGGSSSGSAVAVALGIADLALGTDTAGSGRVPAAFQGIVGIKPTRGLVPGLGVLPACRTLDCVSVFARSLERAELAMAAIQGPHDDDPLARRWPADAPLAAPPQPRVAVPSPRSLADLTSSARRAFHVAVESLREAGGAVVPVDAEPLLAVGALLYGGAFVAERHAAVGRFVEAHPAETDPIVGRIIRAAGALPASQLVADAERRDATGLEAARLFAEVDALLLPTTTRQPTIAEAEANPVDENARLGRYTNFVNMLDLCAVAVPAGEADGGQFGVTIVAPAFADRIAADVARMIVDTAEAAAPATPSESLWEPPGLDLFVVGAHLSGQPLNPQLTESGARLVTAARSAPVYRLYRLDTTPPKPGLVRVDRDGAEVPGELWRLAPAALAVLLAALPQPMALGSVELSDGRWVAGFLCEPVALEGAVDITAEGGWRAHVGAVPQP